MRVLSHNVKSKDIDREIGEGQRTTTDIEHLWKKNTERRSTVDNVQRS